MPASSGCAQNPKNQLPLTPEPTEWLYIVAVLFGALVPDLSLFVMWGWAKSQGIADRVIWDELYYSEYWQQLGAISNSAPLMLVLFVSSCGMARWLANRSSSDGKVGRLLSRRACVCMAGLAAAALLHIACDFPLHHDDGHPHFWPLSDWIFSSPVSYWDPTHLSRYWIPVELALALMCVIYWWRRSPRRWGLRLLLAAATSSYALMAAYWYGSFS